MTERSTYRLAGGAMIAAAVLAAGATAAELLTAPYNPTVSLYALDGPVHLVKYLAMLTLLVTLPAAYVAQRATAGRLGLVGLVLLLLGLGLAGTPYNVQEMSLSPSLSVAEANAAWEQMMSEGVLLGIAGGLGFLGVIIGIVAFGIASRRAGGAFRRAGTISLVSLVVAIVHIFAMDALPSFIPHPPTWLVLGLAAYGIALWREAVRASAPAAGRAFVTGPAGA
jgi:hypothetical protein